MVVRLGKKVKIFLVKLAKGLFLKALRDKKKLKKIKFFFR